MSPRSFLLLAGAAVVSVGLAVHAVTSRDRPLTAASLNEPLFPGLFDRLNEVRTVRITAPGTMLTVETDGQGWRLAEKGGHPVPAAEVRELVLALANLQLVEAKTARPERLKRLELEEPGGGDASSRRVELLDGDGRGIAAAVIGRTRPGLYGGGRSGVYVRRAGEEQAWLAAGMIEVPTEPLDLLDSAVLDVPPESIARVTLGVDGPAPVAIRRSDAATSDFTVDAAVPAGRAIDRDKVERIAGALGGLTMQDVRPAAETTFPAEARRVRYETSDGLVLDLAIAASGEGDAAEHWVQVTADSRPATAPAPTAEPAASGTAPVEKPASERAKALNARLAGWAYKIPAHAGERLGADLDDLLADKEGTS